MARPKPQRKTLADQIRERVAEGNHTAQAVAESTGVSAAVVSWFLAGDRDVRLETADKLAAVLGLTLAPVRRSAVKAWQRAARSTWSPRVE